MPFLYFDYWYIVLVIPAIIFSIFASVNVNGTYKKYSKVLSRRGLSGSEVAEEILRRNGIYDVSVVETQGKLTDHYSPKEKIIRLSRDVFYGTSVSALGVSAHEAGHAVQHNENYQPISIRNAILPVANFGSMLSMPLILLGFFFNYGVLIDIGIILFAAIIVFQFVTLPVEFNASTRAKKALENFGVLDSDELNGVKKVLSAAAMTYIAALAVSLAQFLRLILLSNSRRR